MRFLFSQCDWPKIALYPAHLPLPPPRLHLPTSLSFRGVRAAGKGEKTFQTLWLSVKEGCATRFRREIHGDLCLAWRKEGERDHAVDLSLSDDPARNVNSHPLTRCARFRELRLRGSLSYVIRRARCARARVALRCVKLKEDLQEYNYTVYAKRDAFPRGDLPGTGEIVLVYRLREERTYL